MHCGRKRGYFASAEWKHYKLTCFQNGRILETRRNEAKRARKMIERGKNRRNSCTTSSINISFWYRGLGMCVVSKYLSQVDKLLKRAYKYGYLMYQVSIVDILNNKDRDLWEKITTDPNHALQVLLPPSRQLELRNRGHEYELPRVRTERFKRVFVNRCLFNFI